MSDERIAGTVRQEVYRSERGDFAVVKVDTPRGLVTVTGPLPEAHEGERLEAHGDWIHDPKHGRQFRAREAKVAPPTGAEAIERYLASGAVEGIGPALAKRIVERFGDETVKVLDERPEALSEVKGIGRKKLATIKADWAASRTTRQVMLFLRGHGIGPVLAERIHARWGNDVSRVLDEDPYAIAREVDGAGFLTADRLARALGMGKDDPRRLRAGLLHVANESLASGHTALPAGELLDGAAKALQAADRAALEQGLRAAREQLELELERADAVCSPPPVDPRTNAPLADDLVYLPPVLRAERGAAQRTAAIVRAGEGRRVRAGDAAGDIAKVAQGQGLELTAAQTDAVRACLEHPLTVITGGPGVGKTTVLRTLAAVLDLRRVRYALAAPTGRAAKRLQEATGHEATTLHRLLEWDPTGGGFGRDAETPLDADLLVVDEASMVDVRLYHAVVRALPAGGTLVLTGDVDQLPSVGPGAVLSDLIRSGAPRVVRLTEVFRQAARSRIVASAHAINRGEVPELEQEEGPTDFFFVERPDGERARDAIVKLVAERIPAKFGLDPIDQVQVLAPMRRGACGTDALNLALRAALLGGRAAPVDEDDDDPRALRRLAAGDKVMQQKNDHEAEVYNGDVGRVVHAADDGAVVVRFDGREVRYTRGEAASRLALSFCATIHKSQGSEYPAVVIPVLTEHWLMLERNLLYTALTRARRLAVLVGQRRAVEAAVKNDTPRQRLTLLAARLRSALS